MAIGYRLIGTFTQSAAAPTVTLPTGTTAGDLLILVVHTANEAVTVTSPSGYTQVTNSPVSTGTAAAAGGVRLTVFWKIAGASEPSVVLSDSGSVTGAAIIGITGHDPVTPIHATAASVQATAVTNWTLPSLAVTGSRLKSPLWLIAQDRDGNSTNNLSAFSNSGGFSGTKQLDETTNTGAGGGLAVYTTVSTIDAGTITTSTVTSSTATTAAFMTLAINEAIPPIDLFADSTVSVTATGSINTSIRLAANATMSVTSNQPELVTPFTLIYADSVFSAAAAGNLSTSIRLAANSASSIAANTPSLNTSIILAANSTMSISSSPTIYGYATFFANSSLGIESSGSIDTGILLAGNSTSSIAANTALLGSEHKFYGDSTFSVLSNTPDLKGLPLFYANSTLGISSDASLTTGVLFAANSNISIGSLALLLPTWQPSGIVFDGARVYSYATPMRFVSMPAASRKVLFTIPNDPIFYGDIRGYRYNVNHMYNFTSPIIRV